jgi:hypothetical protein
VDKMNTNGLKDQYEALILIRDEPFEYDVFVFDGKSISIIGNDNPEDQDEDIKKAIDDVETVELLDPRTVWMKAIEGFGIFEKAVHTPVKTPQKADGSVDYEKVGVGDSIWVTVSNPDSPLAGRHILITKRPDGLFALTGGAGHKQIRDKHGVETKTDALRHLVIGGTPKKTQRDKQLDEQDEEAKRQNAPLLERKKELERYGKEEIDAPNKN